MTSNEDVVLERFELNLMEPNDPLLLSPSFQFFGKLLVGTPFRLVFRFKETEKMPLSWVFNDSDMDRYTKL
jgi:hypothetical protein